MGKLTPSDRKQVFSKSQMRDSGQIDEERIATVKTTRIDLRTRAEFIREINEHWSDVHKRFLLIGRYLRDAKDRLAHGEFEEMVRQDLPFGKNVAMMLRRAAEAVDDSRLAENELPPNYTTIYYLTTLTLPQLALARERGLVNPSLTLNEIKAFKQSLNGGRATEREPSFLRKRREQVREEIQRLQAELLDIERELGTIDGTAEVLDTVG